MSPEIIHSLILVIAIGLSFIFPKTALAQYDLQVASLLFIILFLGRRIAPQFLRSKSRLLESVVFTLIILTTVNTTGGTQSSFFFLVYFLLFSLSILLEPVISVTTTLTLVIFYLLSLPPNQSLNSLMPVFSLAFLTPFAMYLAKEFKTNEELRKDASKKQEDTLLFLSLMIKNHLKNIKYNLENYIGDHNLQSIKKHTKEMEKLIDRFENSSNE